MTASARARVSTTKRKLTSSEANGSYLQNIDPVSTVSDHSNVPSAVNTPSSGTLRELKNQIRPLAVLLIV